MNIEYCARRPCNRWKRVNCVAHKKQDIQHVRCISSNSTASLLRSVADPRVLCALYALNLVLPALKHSLCKWTTMSAPHFIFLATESPLIKAWKRAIKIYFGEDGDEQFSVQKGYLQDIDANLLRNDCMVSPANSYGLMDGG